MVNINYKDVYIKDFYSIAGTLEKNGNLKNVNRYLKDYYDEEKTIEDCEIKLQKEVLKNLTNNNTDLRGMASHIREVCQRKRKTA